MEHQDMFFTEEDISGCLLQEAKKVKERDITKLANDFDWRNFYS